MKKILLLCAVLLFLSCEEIINEVDISTENMQITAPTDAAILTNNTVVFTWEALQGATKYQLQVAKPNFANATQIVLDTIVTTLNFEKELEVATYQWRIRAKNSAYESPYSVQGFTIASTDFSSQVVNLQSPVANLISNQAIQTLIWDAVPDAVDYRVQVWQEDTSGSLIADSNTSLTSKNISFSEGNFTWQVRAQNASTNTAYSDRTILIDTTAPNTQNLTEPTDNQVLSGTSVNFTWTRNALAGSVEKDSLYIYSDVSLTNLVHKNEVSSNSYTHSLTAASTYYWYMQSFDAAGNTGTASSTFSFTLN